MCERIINAIKERRDAWKEPAIKAWENSPKANGLRAIRTERGEPVVIDTIKGHIVVRFGKNEFSQVEGDDLGWWLHKQFQNGSSFTLLYTRIRGQLICHPQNIRNNFLIFVGEPVNLRNITE